MRGSLNSNYRKNEMIRINRGNKKILEQLRKVGPAVGTIEEWQDHEKRSNSLKRHIMGFNLERKYRNMFSQHNTHTYMS